MTRREPDAASGHRREQFAAEVRHAIQDLIGRGLNDPRVEGMVTITTCNVSADGQHADILVSVLPAKNQAKVIAGLRHAAGHLRRQVGERIRNRRIPALHFELDLSLKKQAATIEALAKVAAERSTKDQPPPTPAPDAGGAAE
jgi:ribosome-binding factor A